MFQISERPDQYSRRYDILSTSPPKNHAVLYIRAIYRIYQISFFFFFAWSASFWCLKPENTIKSFNMTCVAMRSRILSNSHFLAKRPVMIRREICPIRAEISTNKHGENCIFLICMISRYWFQTKFFPCIA